MAVPPDPSREPGAFFRDMLGQWEQMANQFGGQALKTGEFAQVMQGASAATMQAQSVTHQMMDRALAAANMPSRAEVIDLSARLARIEEAVTRIESVVMAQAGIAPSGRPKPKRTRTAPHKS